MTDRHHLLECILWPNGDGTFRKIINTQKRLEELGVYNDYKLTIPIDRSIHQTMHAEFKKGTQFERSGKNHPMYGRTGDKNPMYGRRGEKAPMYGKGYLMSGEKAPMYGRIGEKCPVWKGDNAKASSIYIRALRRYKKGMISEEELNKARDLRREEYNKRR